MCFYFYNAVVCETKVTKTMSIKCIIQFVNTLNKIHFYVWSIDGVLFIHVIIINYLLLNRAFFTVSVTYTINIEFITFGFYGEF